MVKSLCGQSPCPSICVRVCHCPAGLARSHELAGMLRNRREFTRSRHSPQARMVFYKHDYGALNRPGRRSPSIPCPPNVDPETGEIKESRTLNPILDTFLGEKLPPTKRAWRKEHPSHYGSHSLKPYTSWALLTAFLALIAFFVFFGALINGPSLMPDYDVPDAYTPPDWVQDLQSRGGK